MAKAEIFLQKARAELEKAGSKHKAWLPYYINLSAVYNYGAIVKRARYVAESE